MKKKVKITEATPVSQNLYFDTMVTFPEEGAQRVRFVALDNMFGVLSNHKDWERTLDIEESLRFADEFAYTAQWGAPMARGGYSTIGEFFTAWRRFMPDFPIELIEGQTAWIEPRKPAKNEFISSHYTQGIIYTGKNSYHNSHSVAMNTPNGRMPKYRIGVELEVECKDSRKHEEVKKFKSNWFQMERDGSLNENGIEFITIPLRPRDARSSAFWTPLCTELRKYAVSWDSPRCGLHVHVGREILGTGETQRWEVVGKLLYLYHHYLKNHERNTHIFGRAEGYRDLDGKSKLVDIVDAVGKSCLRKRKVSNALSTDLREKSSHDRYFDINITPRNTIEFRRGRGSLSPDRIAAVVEYCELMCKYARGVKWEQISDTHFYKWLNEQVTEGDPLHQLLQ